MYGSSMTAKEHIKGAFIKSYHAKFRHRRQDSVSYGAGAPQDRLEEGHGAFQVHARKELFRMAVVLASGRRILSVMAQ